MTAAAIQEQVLRSLVSAAEPQGQLALSAGSAPEPDSTFSTVRRTELDAFSWVDFVPGWLTAQDVLFAELARVAGWEQRERRLFNQVFLEPRFTAEYTDLAQAPVPELQAIAAVLSEHYGTVYDGVWMNFYRDHRDGAGWHADRPANKPEQAVVPVLSLGAPRRFLIKPAAGGRSITFRPAGGDLLVMGGRAQRDWRHAAPKQTAAAGPRISLNFTSRAQVGADSGTPPIRRVN